MIKATICELTGECKHPSSFVGIVRRSPDAETKEEVVLDNTSTHKNKSNSVKNGKCRS
jgi:hypothetical protein